MRFQTIWVLQQFQNRWSTDSTSIIQRGHCGSIWQLRRNKVPLPGSALWPTCHEKILILSIVSRCQIHLNSRGCWDTFDPCASQVADLVENSPEPVNPQQKESTVSTVGIAMPIIFCKISWLCISSNKIFINLQTYQLMQNTKQEDYLKNYISGA